MTKYLKINSVDQIGSILDKINTEEYSLVNYVWTEYGFHPVFFNELFREFFDDVKGPKIGFCFPGHEIFYEKYVDILVTLEGFTDTSKAYKDNKETDLLLNNFNTLPDRGVAFGILYAILMRTCMKMHSLDIHSEIFYILLVKIFIGS